MIYRKNEWWTTELLKFYHPELNKAYQILQKIHRHTLQSARLSAVLPSPPKVVFCNAKTFNDTLARPESRFTDQDLEIKIKNYNQPGVYICGRKYWENCNISCQGNTFVSTYNGNQFIINFPFDCNCKNAIYLLPCKICKKQYRRRRNKI